MVTYYIEIAVVAGVCYIAGAQNIDKFSPFSVCGHSTVVSVQITVFLRLIEMCSSHIRHADVSAPCSWNLHHSVPHSASLIFFFHFWIQTPSQRCPYPSCVQNSYYLSPCLGGWEKANAARIEDWVLRISSEHWPAMGKTRQLQVL